MDWVFPFFSGAWADMSERFSNESHVFPLDSVLLAAI